MIKGIENILKNQPKLIQNMKPGDSGYSVSWASVILKNGDVYLNGKYDIEDHCGGTLQLFIKKLTDNEWEVDFSKCYRYDYYADTLEDAASCVMGSVPSEWIKVGNITQEFKRLKN